MSTKSESKGTLLGAIFLILFCQLAGEVFVRLVNAPVPGPVFGMVLLFLYLCIKRHVPQSIETVGGTLLSHLSLLFVPAGVGVIRYAHHMQDELMALTASIVGGTIASIAFVAWIAQRVLPKGEERHE